MNTSSVLSPFWDQESKENRIIQFHPSREDSTHFIVSRLLEEGTETIGHVYVEIEDDDFRYISTNRIGKEIFPPTTDFNLVEMKFDRYARLLALQQKSKENYKHLKIINHMNTTNKMKTQTKNTEQKTKKENQLRFIEYEKPTKEGHFITIGDSYHNVIGRVHKSYNEEIKKYEYVAFDHAGNIITKSDKLWEVKNEFVKNRETLLEQAHQRRIESKQQSKEIADEKQEVNPSSKNADRKTQMQQLREDKTGRGQQTSKENEKVNDESSKGRTDNLENNHEEEREQELRDIRDTQDEDRGEMDLER